MKKVIGIIGVIGSGKDFTCNRLSSEFSSQGYSVRRVDFSDTVREFTFDFLGISPYMNPEIYQHWKDEYSMISAVEGGDFYIKNREFLTNIGGKMRGLDNWFWANRTLESVEKQEATDITIFNSCRYPEEAANIFKYSAILGVEPTFIFTNFISERYTISDDDSEQFARYFLKKGFEDQEVITEAVKQKLEEKYGAGYIQLLKGSKD